MTVVIYSWGKDAIGTVTFTDIGCMISYGWFINQPLNFSRGWSLEDIIEGGWEVIGTL